MPAVLNIIVVEDHDVLREELVSFLHRPQWEVRGVDCGEALDMAMRSQPAHLIILDLNLPFEDGLSIAQRLRTSWIDIGIIILTARSQLTQRRVGYQTGADVYLTKPANMPELESVVQNLARRLVPAVNTGMVLRMGQLTLTGKNGLSLKLTRTEAQLLHYLATAPERQIDTDFLLRKLSQNYAIETSRENLTVTISRLRTKINLGLGAGEGEMLKSVWGFGYQLMANITIE